MHLLDKIESEQAERLDLIIEDKVISIDILYHFALRMFSLYGCSGSYITDYLLRKRDLKLVIQDGDVLEFFPRAFSVEHVVSPRLKDLDFNRTYALPEQGQPFLPFFTFVHKFKNVAIKNIAWAKGTNANYPLMMFIQSMTHYVVAKGNNHSLIAMPVVYVTDDGNYDFGIKHMTPYHFREMNKVLEANNMENNMFDLRYVVERSFDTPSGWNRVYGTNKAMHQELESEMSAFYSKFYEYVEKLLHNRSFYGYDRLQVLLFLLVAQNMTASDVVDRIKYQLHLKNKYGTYEAHITPTYEPR